MRCTRPAILATGLLFTAVLASSAQEGDCGPRTLEDLQRMSGKQLLALFKGAPLGRPLDGTARGRLVHLTDRVLPRLKCRLANSMWRGKTAQASDGYFINRWIGGVRWIDSHYTIGPSWIDGKPAVLMEYAPGTPLFWNMHDELREVAPGLYLGPVIHRFPCPYFRGFVALQMEPCDCK